VQDISMKKTIIPIGVGLLVLVLFNIGLYSVLGVETSNSITIFSLPYTEDFADFDVNTYQNFGGDWDVRDEALVQINLTGLDLGTIIPMEIPDDQPYTFSTDIRWRGGEMGGGVLFNLQQTISRQQSHMVRFNVDGGNLYLIYGYFGDDSNFIGQGNVLLERSTDFDEWQQLKLEVNNAGYSILLDGEVLISGIPLEYQGGSVGFITSTSQIAFDNLVVEAGVSEMTEIAEATSETIDDPTADTDTIAGDELNRTLFVNDSFEGVGGESIWIPISGNWVYQDSAFVQTQTEGFDLAAYYPQSFDNIYLKTILQHIEGAGGGVLFNMSQEGTHWDSHMVRYVEDGSVLAWGYFDIDGIFQGQGSQSVPLANNEIHILEIYSDGTTYDIVLDGETIATDISLNSTKGYVGLTASQSSVAYDAVEIYAFSDRASVLDDVDTINGEWISDGDTLIQISNETTDYIAGVGLAGEAYTMSVDIRLPIEPNNAGGGVVFHMDDRDNPTNGVMVRLADGGQGIFWGTYNVNGIFSGEGSRPLDVDTTEPIRLSVAVNQNNYTIQVNDELVAQDISLTQSQGWIGLISFRGGVEFSNLNISIDGLQVEE